MGCDVYITRQSNWFRAAEAKRISEVEWRSVVEADSEMWLCGFAEATSPQDGTVRYENPLLAEWLGHPHYSQVWFDFRDGNVVVKNPDELVVKKMKQLAHKLDAGVQGEEGEFIT